MTEVLSLLQVSDILQESGPFEYSVTVS